MMNEKDQEFGADLTRYPITSLKIKDRVSHQQIFIFVNCAYSGEMVVRTEELEGILKILLINE